MGGFLSKLTRKWAVTACKTPLLCVWYWWVGLSSFLVNGWNREDFIWFILKWCTVYFSQDGWWERSYATFVLCYAGGDAYGQVVWLIKWQKIIFFELSLQVSLEWLPCSIHCLCRLIIFPRRVSEVLEIFFSQILVQKWGWNDPPAVLSSWVIYRQKSIR